MTQNQLFSNAMRGSMDWKLPSRISAPAPSSGQVSAVLGNPRRHNQTTKIAVMTM